MIYEENRVFNLDIEIYEGKFGSVIYKEIYYFAEYPLKIIRRIDSRI